MAEAKQEGNRTLPEGKSQNSCSDDKEGPDMLSKVHGTSKDISRIGDPLLSERKPQKPPRRKNQKHDKTTEFIGGPALSQEDEKDSKDDTKATGRGRYTSDEKGDKRDIVQQSADSSKDGNQTNDAPKEKNITGITSSYTKTEIKDVECWKYTMVKLEIIEKFPENEMTYMPEERKLVITGNDPGKIRMKFFMLCRDIQHREIKLDNHKQIEFLLSPIVSSFIDRKLQQKNLNAHWEINKKHSVIHIYACQSNNLQEAYDLVRHSFCILYSKAVSSEKWTKKVRTFLEEVGKSVDFYIDKMEQAVFLCTKDLEEKVVRFLDDLHESIQLVSKTLSLKKGEMALLKEYFGLCAELKVAIKSDDENQELVFSGTQEDVEQAMTLLLEQASKLKHREIPLQRDWLNSFLRNEEVVTFVNNTLRAKNHTCYWGINETNQVIDVCALEEDTLQEAYSTIQKAYCVEEISFDESDCTFADFLDKAKSLQNRSAGKIAVNIEGNDISILHTSDLYSEVTVLKKVCSVQTDCLCSGDGAFEFLLKFPNHLSQIKQTYFVNVEPCIKEMKFIIKGSEDNLKKAKQAIGKLVKNNVLTERLPVSRETAERFMNGADQKVRQEFESYFHVHILSKCMAFNNYDFHVHDDCAVTLTNRIYMPEKWVAQIVAREDISDIKPEASIEQGSLTVLFPKLAMNNLKTGKDKDALDKLFESLLEVVHKRDIKTVVLPLDDFKGTLDPVKFVKLFLWRLQRFIKNHTNVSTVVIQVLDKDMYPNMLNTLNAYFSPERDRSHHEDLVLKKEKTSIPVCVIEGQLAQHKADVLVNPVGRNLDLKYGAVSKSLLNAAGIELQSEVKAMRSGEGNTWEMIVTGGHNLPCKKVFHVILDGYNKNKRKKCLKRLGTLIQDCLCEMDSSKLRTIAFPVIGTGQLQYSPEDVADVIMTTVEEYGNNCLDSSVQKVDIVVFPQANKATKQMIDKKLEKYPKCCSVGDVKEANEKRGEYELVIVGLKDDVAKAKLSILKKLQDQEEEKDLEDRKFTTQRNQDTLSLSSVTTVKERTISSSSGETKKSKAKRAQIPQKSGDITALDKLLVEVKVELRNTFIDKLPDKAILNMLGMFDVRMENKENKCWLRGKLSDMEKVGELLITAVKSPAQLYQTKNILKDVYDLVCDNFLKRHNRSSFDISSNKVTFLKMDKELEDCISKYSQYQFDELFAKPSTGNDSGAVQTDKRAAETLKQDKPEHYKSVEFFVSPSDRILKIAAPDFTTLESFKFALEIKTNRKQVRGRHGRIKPSDEPLMRSGNQAVQQPNTQQFHASDKNMFTTTEGIDVYVYKSSILKLRVDCIVNAANKEMEHGGGVAKVISKAAGHRFNRESRHYHYNNGDLKVGECCKTTAGNLDYKYVIHTVGPNINNYAKWDYDKMRTDLKKAVRVCFDQVEQSGLHSVGMTSISSGVYGVPKHWCAEEYAMAVKEYSRERGRITTLKEIHFVDVNIEMLAEINKAFQEAFAQSLTPDKNDRKKNEMGLEKQTENYAERVDAQPKHCYPTWAKEMRGGIKYVFEMNQYLRVILYTGDITKFTTGAIACSQDTELRNLGGLAKAINSLAGLSVEMELKEQRAMKPRVGDTIVTGPGDVSCAAIYHVVTPDFTSQIGQTLTDAFLKDIRSGYVKCLQTASERRVYAVAIPLFGCGLLSTHHDKLAETFLHAVLDFTSDPVSTMARSGLQEIHAINLKEGVTHAIKKSFVDFIDGVAGEAHDFRGADAFAENRFPTGSGKHSDPSLTITTNKIPKQDEKKQDEKAFPDADISPSDTCPICMDNFNNPKTLSKCGHVFCNDCIDNCFKVNPKCPTCSMVYGIITGDQPEGDMSNYTDKTIHLRGFEDVNTIVILYKFRDGIQESGHPNPGCRYGGIRRRCYLPDNRQGRLILEMLKIAFDRKLVFTIGDSRTTGREGVITWNDIHHKTDLTPNSTFGYPDATYFDRVQDELAAKGVTPNDISKPCY